MSEYKTIKQATDGFSKVKVLVNSGGLYVAVEEVDPTVTCNYKLVAMSWIGEEDGGDEYQVMISGSCSYDGMRHCDFGDEGYVNYLDIKKMIVALSAIYKFEYESSICHSSECDDSDFYRLICGVSDE